jgi:hypothetical protein
MACAILEKAAVSGSKVEQCAFAAEHAFNEEQRLFEYRLPQQVVVGLVGRRNIHEIFHFGGPGLDDHSPK